MEGSETSGSVPYRKSVDEDAPIEIEPDPTIDLDSDSFPINRYKPLRKIGMGAAGSVYVCLDLALEKHVAVKTLRALTRDQLVAFQTEARVLSRLDHPNIVGILDFGATPSGAPYMVLTYDAGVNLRKHIDDAGCLDANLAITMFGMLADALSYCHAHDILHRDLKPENILFSVRKNGSLSVKLIDFGIALVVDQEKTTVDGRVIAGTPAYMSPDQVQGKKYDARSEIYSLGCVFFEALAGRPPFTGETALDVLSQHARVAPPAVSEIANQPISAAVETVIAKCLEKHPADRFQSMKDFRDALALAVEPESSVPGGSDNATSKPATKLMVALVSLFCIGALLLSFVLFSSKPVPKTRVRKLSASEMRAQERDEYILEATRKHWGTSIIFSKTVWHAGANTTDDDLEPIIKLRPTRISLAGSGVTVKGLRKLKSLPLEVLDLQFMGLSDADIPDIAAFKKLDVLILNDSLITAEGIRGLATLRDLRRLSLSQCPNLYDDGYNLAFEQFPKLTYLDLSRSNATAKCLTRIGKLKELRVLEICSMSLSDESMAALVKLDVLDLNLSESKYSAKWLKEFPKMSQLKKLELKGVHGVTSKQLMELKNSLAARKCMLQCVDLFSAPGGQSGQLLEMIEFAGK
jgi:serine/threonine protein kinase